MTRIHVDVPDDLVARAEQAGRGDVGSYLLSLLRADLDGVTPELEALLLKRLDAPDAGEITDGDFNAIRERVRIASKGTAR